jgi:hypothetical protein
VDDRPGESPARAPWVGLAVGAALVLLAATLPRLLDWPVTARSSPEHAAEPLHGLWDPIWFGPGTLPTLVLAVLGCVYAVPLAARLRWRWLLVAAFATALAWMLSLALVDGTVGISRALAHPYEYLGTARSVTDVGAMLHQYVARIDADNPDNWPTHVAGHPPLAVMFFIGLVRIGLGGDLAAGLVVVVLAATTAPAVLVTLRALGAEPVARRAAPFLVLGPAAVFMAVSADALFGAVAAWGLAALALAATRRDGWWVAWAVLAGLLLGACVMLSYGLPLLGLLALAVLHLGGRWRPLPVAAAVALAVVLGFALAGFAWWDAYPALDERYWRGLAKLRPASYWLWGNLAALLLSAGLLLAAGVGQLLALRRRAEPVVLWLVGAAAASVLLADASRMSKAEVERIWLPFVPWLLLSVALLPERWRRWGLVLQVATAVVIETLLYTTW